MKTNNTPFNQSFFNAIAETFDSHVSQSIPLFDLLQKVVVKNIVNFQSRNVLDICGSSGKLGCDLNKLGFSGDYLCLDGSPKMQKVFDSFPKVKNLRFDLSGFLNSWIDETGQTIPMFCNYSARDCITEILGFQFFTKEREKEVKKIANMLTTDGVFITFEKFAQKEDVWAKNENLKDSLWKSRFFSMEQIKEKKEKVLDAMSEYLYLQSEYESVLNKNFPKVQRFAQIGNFAGYICFNNPDTAKEFLFSDVLLCNEFTYNYGYKY